MFRRDESGATALIFALALPVLLVGVGGAIEASRAVSYRQRLASATELSCTQSAAFVNGHKPVDVKVGELSKTYPQDVARITALNFTAKNFTDPSTVVTTSTTDINVHVEATGTMDLIFSSFLNTENMTFAVSRDCATVSALQAPTTGRNDTLLVSESFERPDHGVAYNSWDVLKTANPDGSYGWHGWVTQNAGIEINGLRELASNTIRAGDFFAELDSDCNTSANRGMTSCRSNSAMSRYLRLTAGRYEIRYSYIARQRDNAIPGRVICGAKDSDVSYYTKDGQTNRIEVFVEKEGDYTFNSSNMVDVCVQADTWTERVINFNVPRDANYRISWRAAGREDTFGGLIDYLRICRNDCPK